MLHAAQSEDLVGQLLNLGPSALDYDDFQTVMGIEMNVRRGKDFSVIVVLSLDQLLR